MDLSFADTCLYVDLKAIQSNYLKLQNMLGTAKSAAVVKADAYGLGAIRIVQALLEVGCEHFFVAHLGEALELRKIYPNINIYAFHGIKYNEAEGFHNNNITPVLNCPEQVKIWQTHAAQLKTTLPCLMHVDTGMTRLGLRITDFEHIMQTPATHSNLDILYVMSHLACADEADHFMNARQLARFQQVRALVKNKNVKFSLSNSSGIFLGPAFHHDLARPGMAIYGLNPLSSDKENPMKPVIRLTTKILQIREVTMPCLVGYGSTCEVNDARKLAVVPIGYADGFWRALSNKACLYINNHKAPVLGRVSMDLVTIDVTDIPSKDIHLGQEVEIIGHNIHTDQLANMVGTIGYEILTTIGTRVKRIYSC